MSSARCFRVGFAFALVGIAARSSTAQGYALHQWSGTSNYEQLGEAVTGPGDLDDDGIPDLLIGAIHQGNRGAALLYSGRTGQLLRRWSGTGTDAHFGAAVAGLGDVDGDGVIDILVGAPYEQPGGVPYQGEANVYSGASGARLYTYAGVDVADFLGWAVAALGDVDGDRVPDFAIGRPNAQVGGVWSRGEVGVYSGASGLPIRFLAGLGGGHSFGHAVANAGDVNRDGVPDLLVGAPFANPGRLSYAGYAHLISGADGAFLRDYPGATSGDRLGYSVAGTGDLDGDGAPDALVGAPQRDLQRPSSGAGYVKLFSGASGNELLTLAAGAPNEGLGYAVTGTGDLDGDGTPDFAAGAPWASTAALSQCGVVRVFSGASGTLLVEIAGRGASDYFGASVALAGDVNEDGLPDLIAGAPEALPLPLFGPGYAIAFSITGIPAGAAITGASCTGSGGHAPRIATFGGLPAVGNARFGFALQRGLGGSAAALFASPALAPHPTLIAGCALHLLPPLFPLASTMLGGAQAAPGAGYRLVSTPIPAEPSLTAALLSMQWIAIDPAGPGGLLSASAALSVVIAP